MKSLSQIKDLLNPVLVEQEDKRKQKPGPEEQSTESPPALPPQEGK